MTISANNSNGRHKSSNANRSGNCREKRPPLSCLQIGPDLEAAVTISQNMTIGQDGYRAGIFGECS